MVLKIGVKSHYPLNPHNWEVHSGLRPSGWCDSENRSYEFTWTFELIEEAFAIYQSRLGHGMRSLVIPEEWKVLTEEANTLSSVLCRTLKLYFDYLVDLSQIFYNRISYISYENITHIEDLPFPTPQLISKCRDPRFYIRLSKALLHMFSYPGITTCRLEMDAERNTSLLLYSLFDWFGVIQSCEPGSSVDEIIDSIRVFKRNSEPQWTTDGLIPIIFFPQRLQSRSEQRRIAWTVQDLYFCGGQLFPGLYPLAAAVERTLNLLLVHSIADWKEKRTKDEGFVLPDWLFLHGIVYNTVIVTPYSFFPKIVEFTSDGVPSRWEFICIPTEPFDYSLFSSREPTKRTSVTTILLAIKRHTDRICRVLDSLKLDPDFSPAIFEFVKEEKQDKELDDEGMRCVDDSDVVATPGSVDDSLDRTGVEAATQCLLDCIDRTGINLYRREDHTTLDDWSFLDAHLHPKFDAKLGSIKDFMVEFTDSWKCEKISLPEDWFTATLAPVKTETFMGCCGACEIISKLQLQVWTRGQTTSFIQLTESELHARHFSPLSFVPDFFLSTPARKERRETGETGISLDDLRPDSTHCLEHFKDVYQYVSHELDAKLAMSSPFSCTPGCWLKYDTQSRFPPALFSDTPPTAVDFSLLLHPIQTVPIPMPAFTPDVRLRATILNPALVVAIQGPALWPDEFACSPALSHQRPKDKSEALRELAKAIEPSLKTHLINWQLRFEQGLVPSKDLPPWFMLFGLIYDAEEVTIVAHIPYMTDTSQYSFISCIVDTISFPMVDGCSKTTDPWYLDRFRVGLALLSLQKHAFNMAGLWECVIWPDELVSWEEILEREYLGPVLTPLERGYMVPLDPMSQVYLDVHGSDETILDHSGDVSEDENEDEEVDDEDGYNDADETIVDHSGDVFEYDNEDAEMENMENGEGDYDYDEDVDEDEDEDGGAGYGGADRNDDHANEIDEDENGDGENNVETHPGDEDGDEKADDQV